MSGQGGYQLHHALFFVLLRLPGRIYELMPVTVLIGTLYALSTLARHSEITVLRASGLSTARLLSSLLQVAIACALITFVIGEAVAPGRTGCATGCASRNEEKPSDRICAVACGSRMSATSSMSDRAAGYPPERGANLRLRPARRTAFRDRGGRRRLSPPDRWHLSEVVPDHTARRTRRSRQDARHAMALGAQPRHPLGTDGIAGKNVDPASLRRAPSFPVTYSLSSSGHLPPTTCSTNHQTQKPSRRRLKRIATRA